MDHTIMMIPNAISVNLQRIQFIHTWGLNFDIQDHTDIALPWQLESINECFQFKHRMDFSGT